MSMMPTIAPSPASSRLRASWSSAVPTTTCDWFAPVVPMVESADYAGAGSIGHMGHMGTNLRGTTGSKRLVPGSLDEVST